MSTTAISSPFGVGHGSGDERGTSNLDFVESIATISGLKTPLFSHHGFAGALHWLPRTLSRQFAQSLPCLRVRALLERVGDTTRR